MVGIHKGMSSLKLALMLTTCVSVLGADSALVSDGQFDRVRVEPGHVMTSLRQSRSLHDCAATCLSARCSVQPCCTGFCQSLTSSACYLNMTSESTELPLPDGSLGFKCYVRDIDECVGDPCQNGEHGTCVDQVNGYLCQCVIGYTDSQCQTDIDECVGDPCQNGGTCVDQINGYLCQCVLGYTDSQCQTEFPICPSDTNWQAVPGTLTTVSVGPAGVWGVTTDGRIVHRDGTYHTSGSTIGTGWTHVADTDQGSLRRLDVGDDVVWGVTVQGTLACRQGINKNSVTGTSWLTMPHKARDIAVSARGQIIGLSQDGKFFYREGLDSECSSQGNWINTSSAVNLTRISIGGAGIWATDNERAWIYYRPGSIRDDGILGTEWTKLSGNWMTVSMGTFFGIGVNPPSIWQIVGVSESTPGGSEWAFISGENWVDVDTTEGACYAWGMKDDGSIHLLTFH